MRDAGDTPRLVLHWFNPLVWYAVHRIRTNGELACDAAALSHAGKGENGPYAQTMIKLVERFSAPTLVPGLAGVLEKACQMKRRIEFIAGFEPTHPVPCLRKALTKALRQ